MRDFIGKSHLGREQEGEGTQVDCSATWLVVSGYIVMGIVSRLSLANHSDSWSFLVVHALLSQDECQQEGFWEVVEHVASPFNLSQTLAAGGGFLVTCSLLGSPVVKQLMQNYYGAWPVWAVLVIVFPLTSPGTEPGPTSVKAQVLTCGPLGKYPIPFLVCVCVQMHREMHIYPCDLANQGQP